MLTCSGGYPFLRIFKGTAYFARDAKQYVYGTKATALTVQDRCTRGTSLTHQLQRGESRGAGSQTMDPYWRDRSVVLNTDSKVTQASMNKSSSTNPCINSLLHKTARGCALIICRIWTVHVAGNINNAADTASRLNEDID